MKRHLILFITTLAFSHSLTAAEPQRLTPVSVEPVQELHVNPKIEFVGSIYSRNNAQLTAGVGGRLQWIAEPGAEVQKNQKVAQIDPLPLQLQQQEQQAQIKRARIEMDYLRGETERLAELAKTHSASAFELAQMRSRFALAQSDLDIARVRLAQIDDQLKRTAVLAPYAGVITERLREAGSDVNRSDILVMLLDTQQLEARIQVPVRYLSAVRQNKEVLLHQHNESLLAPVSAIIPSANMRSQSFELRVKLPAGDQSNWTSGQHITASLPIALDGNRLKVHRDALLLRQDGTFVVVVDNQNVAHRQKVIVGPGEQDWVSVLSDSLKAGDRVAIRGAERLTDGQRVSITNS
ncbi:efflux RND transporter periplasmic adaptor subunit [Lacimicrobium alkaliphilum]|uniref:MexH family multidrug efflux RND transporter periplasmic adaptor subunit n=1 Tax=Lacimicrobium alkaliphilum TaxID=1526571 RepID=A0ABQ1RQE1_9ALTE|nr:efflux RND transporter periplasmic adaptor subunit [Lacimicrobium alkaliphilum]GGD74394.1 MexH family multidrug efflux RND transporter periplasmic adaptor subunit [Lacimicrobium alkaliphilum]